MPGLKSRRQQVERYLSGKNKIVVSTDAIGMGQNLPIRRVVFTKVEKFNGKEQSPISPMLIRQIAGRAGRYGMYDVGYVTATRGLDVVREALSHPLPPLEKAYIGFPGQLLDMPETKLLPSKLNTGYFAVKRFDRERDTRVHTVSVSGLLETSHRIPNLDYHILMQLTMQLTHSYEEIEKIYRQMCFNVFAHNRDDHSKNFTFLHKDDKWQLSPAYDLTYSNSIGGEHATTVNGNGRDPGMEDLLAVAGQIKLDEKWARRIAENIREIVFNDLRKYLNR